MNDVIASLLPVMIGAAAVPLYPIMVLLLLQSKGGLLKAVAFVLGGVALRLAQGFLFGRVFGAAADTQTGDGPVVSTLLLVLGILLLISAVKKWRKEEDPDAPPPGWMTKISGLSTLAALGAGALYVLIAVKQWVFTLSAIGVISEAGLSEANNVTLYLLYVLVTQALVLPPILMYAVAPRQSARPLNAAQAWLERNNRVIMIVVSLVFGTWFTYKGISGLMG